METVRSGRPAESPARDLESVRGLDSAPGRAGGSGRGTATGGLGSQEERGELRRRFRSVGRRRDGTEALGHTAFRFARGP